MKITRAKDLAAWAEKRAINIDRMVLEVRKDDTLLFRRSMELLDKLAALLSGVGDEVGSLYAAELARQLENKVRAAGVDKVRKKFRKPTRR